MDPKKVKGKKINTSKNKDMVVQANLKVAKKKVTTKTDKKNKAEKPAHLDFCKFLIFFILSF